MEFAVVELKYVEKGTHIVRTANIQCSKPKPSAVDAYFCYISSDITDEPDFNAKYKEKFDGEPGLFRVFIKKITKTYEEAVNFIKGKRQQVVPKKFRQPSNTDTELKAMASKRKKIEKKVQNANKKTAATMNSSYLAKLLSAENNSLTVASQFEALVKQTLEESSKSDSESEMDTLTEESPPIVANYFASVSNERIENAAEIKICTLTNDAVEENRKSVKLKNLQPTVKKPKMSLLSLTANSVGTNKSLVPAATMTRKLGTSERPAVTSLSCTHPRPLQQLNQNKQLESLIDNSENISCEATEINISTLTNDTVEENRKSVKPKNLQPTVNKPKMSLLSLTANSVGTNKSLVPAATMPRKLVTNDNPETTLQFSKKFVKRTVLTVGEANVGKSPENNILVESIENQRKRKINTGDTIVKFAQTPKIARNDASSASGSTKESQSQLDLPTPNAVVLNVPDVINIEEMIKQIETLTNENLNLKNENETLKQRNEALQSALVVASTSPAQVMFEEEDGGRRYRDNKAGANVFLNSVQCQVLDAIDNDREFLNSLTVCVFGRETLKNSSITGRPSNRTKQPARPALDPRKLKFIYDIMAACTDDIKLNTKAKINKVINKKMANLRSVGSENRRRKKTVCNVLLPDEISETHDDEDQEDSLDSNEFDNNVELANESDEPTHSTSTDTREVEISDSTENTDLSEPAITIDEPFHNFDFNFLNNDENGDYLMFDLNDLNLINVSAFANENANGIVYIENADNHAATGQQN